MQNWKAGHTAAVIAFIVGFGVLAVVATQLKLTRHDHLGFWSAVVIGALILGLMVAVGEGICRRWDGVLVDSLNRISLAQFQLVVWTLVVLASLGGAFFTNLLADVDPVKALDVSVPPELWLAMGLSAGTFAGAKGLNTIQGLTALDGETPTWGDLFASDYDSSRHVDVAKLQMFVFTVILGFAYAASVANLLIGASGQVSALPGLDSGFVTLLGLSQGGYLAAKVVKGGT